MTELRSQNLRANTSAALARQRYRDGSIPCNALEKDPHGGLVCTRRGMAMDSPHVWHGYQSGTQLLTGSYATLEIDVEDLNTSDDHYSFTVGELEILKRGLLEIEVKVVVVTAFPARFGFEIVIEEEIGTGYVALAPSEASSGRGTI